MSDIMPTDLSLNPESQRQRIGDTIARIVWKIIRREVENTFDDPSLPDQRITFMLTNLATEALEGICRHKPTDIDGKKILLKINPDALESTPEIYLSEDYLSYKSAVSYRHSDEADIIVFAPSDSERESNSASLQTVPHINESKIIESFEDWITELNESEKAKDYFRVALEGLHESKICVDLHMWVDFIHALIDQGFSFPPDKRIKNALPALQIPKDGTTIPPFKPENREPYSRKKVIRNFTKAFEEARYKVGCYARLITPQNEPVQIDIVRRNIEIFSQENTQQNSQETQELSDAIKTIQTLLDDSDNITPTEWRPSQKAFCQKVSWTRIGKKIFDNTPKIKEKLGEKTLRFIGDNYPDDITKEERDLLTDLKETKPSEPCSAEVDFFNRWQERLFSKDIKLFKKWQKRIFSKEVICHDLLSTLAEGFEALIDASDTLDKIEKPRILVRTTKHNKPAFWRELDKAIYQRFCFELNTMKGLFKPYVVWDLQAAEEAAKTNTEQKSSTLAEKRTIDLELFLVDESDIFNLDRDKPRDPPLTAPRVKIIWQPGNKSPKDEPISLAFIDDIQALAQAAEKNDSLFHSLTFIPNPIEKSQNSSVVELSNRYSFHDVTQEQQGRTFNLSANGAEKNLCETLRTLVEKLEIDSSEKENLLNAAQRFNTSYCETIKCLSENPQKAFTSDLLDQSAQAFGDLCAAACQLRVRSWQEKREIQKHIAQIGVITSKTSTHSAQPLAILPAWHPFRLAEWRAKIKKLASLIESILTSRTTQDADFSTVFQQYRLTQSRWFFPEVIFAHETTMISVENLCGYSLMLPIDALTKNQEALNLSLSSAVETLNKGIRRYLNIYPHKAINLSVTLFDLESERLLSEVIKDIRAHLLQDYPHLHCTLIITHHDQERLRDIYHSQNKFIETMNFASDQSSSSHLYIRVQHSEQYNQPSENTPSIRENDILFLHHGISHNDYAHPCWTEEKGEAQELSPHFDLTKVPITRHHITVANTPKTSIYLTLPEPPRAIAYYQNLVYECSKKSFLRDGSRATFVQQINFEEPKLCRLIEHIHCLSEWVITYDKIASKPLLEHCKVQIIGDISTPESDERTLISAGEVHNQLTHNIKQNLMQTCDIEEEKAEKLAIRVIKDVLKISGQKMLSAAQYANASREILGLTVMRHWIEKMLQNSQEQAPIWISLDDYRSWFMPEKGLIADAVALTIDKYQEKFRISLQVCEAKFVEKNAKDREKKDAFKQIENTIDHFIRRFIDNEDTISRTAECQRLADLLINFINQDSTALPDIDQRRTFFEALNRGDILFRISGEIVICLHDDHDNTYTIDHDIKRSYLRYHIITTPTIRQIIENHPINDKELSDIPWYCGRLPNKSDNLNVSFAHETTTTPITHPKEEIIDPTKIPPKPPATTSKISEQENINRSYNTQEDTQKANILPDNRSFFPPPVRTILSEIATHEKGTMADPESLEWAKKTAKDIQRALSSFDMQAEFAEEQPRLTPNCALIAFLGHDSLTFEKIEKRKSELLTTYGIDVADIRRGRGQILLFVRREKRAKVFLASTWLRSEKDYQNASQNKQPQTERYFSFLLGAREDSDNLLYLNLTAPFAGYEQHAPHTLIAGETGSGKGILTQGILLQLITLHSPRDIELIVIDPKQGVDFTWLKNAPQMKQHIITKKESARSLFEELTRIMNERYKKLESFNAPDITAYNRKVSPPKRLPRIFVVHDELGAWMAQEKDYQETVLSSVANLGMKSRAAGIHLILITQRADAEVIPPRLRDNIGNKLCLKVRDNTASRIALGVGGAEKLLGQGHLACCLGNQEPPHGQDFFTVQVPFIETEDIERIAKAAKDYWSKDYWS